MQSFANSSDAASQRPPSAQANSAGPKPAGPPVKPPGTADVKPRLTKEQHDILERHFAHHHKPSTTTKKGFAEALGVPLDKINNWFQNRRAKVKQDMKKQLNQYNMSVGNYSQQQIQMAPGGHAMPPMAVPATMAQYTPHIEQPQPQLSLGPGFFPMTADTSPASLPAQGMEGPSALDIGPGQQPMMLQPPQYDMHQSLGSIREANGATSYDVNGVAYSLMAATAGAPFMQASSAPMMQNNHIPMQPQGQNFMYERETPNGLPSETHTPFQMPVMSDMAETPDGQFGGFQDYLSYMPFISTAPNDLQITTGAVTTDDSPYSGTQSNGTNQSSLEPPQGSVASLTSRYSGWTDDNHGAEANPSNDFDDSFDTPYNMPQASASEAALPFWGSNAPGQRFSRLDMYQHSNASAHAVLSSPHQSGRSLSAGPTEYDSNFGDEVFNRRNSSTSNLATNIEAIHLQNTTPEGFNKSPNQSSIATRRQKRPTALNSNTLRSASYSGSMPSPGNNGDHTLRRIRSSGIGNAGRVQKPQPGSAQRSPMSLTFSEAASSPKFQRTLSSSSMATVGHGGSLAPPTPQTPNEPGRFPYWQSNPVFRNPPQMPDHNSPDSGANWSLEPSGPFVGESPPSGTMDAAQLHQARLGNDGVYRDTPPQSAPATQQAFPRANTMQPPRLRAAFHSSADLTLQQPKPSHMRRPSLPVDTPGQGDGGNSLSVPTYGGFNYDDFKDFPLSGIQHNVPFAPPVSAMPDFLVNEYVPPGDGIHGHMRRTTEPTTRSFIFANQSPSDFRSS